MSTEEDSILQRARALPRSGEPERDLWSKIEAALDRSSAAAEPLIRHPWLMAAGVVLVLTSAVSFWLGGVMNTSEPQLAPINGDMLNRFGPRYSMGPGFGQARMDLSISVADQLEQVSPATRVLFEQNLELIEDTVYEINTALRGNPDNDLLQQLLLSTYTEELLLLGEMDALTQYIKEGTEL